MCGRYYLETHLPPEDTPESLESLLAAVPDRPAGDVCPGMEAPVILRREDRLLTQAMRWGFTAPGGGLTINARLETLRERPLFRGLADRQRCAMPAAGYYEWRDGDGQKYRVGFAAGEWFCLAGLYRYGQAGLEFVVITQPPAPEIAPIHDRMPLMLDLHDDLWRWMDGAQPPFAVGKRLRVSPVGPEQLQMAF